MWFVNDCFVLSDNHVISCFGVGRSFAVAIQRVPPHDCLHLETYP